MTNGNDGAFGDKTVVSRIFEGERVNTVAPDGLTKREYFVAMAMQGVVTAWSEGNIPWHEENPALVADRAVSCADALIEALNK